MSEKKAKEERKEQKKVIVEYHIKGFADGNVEISGPIKNLLLFRRIMNDAERAVLDMQERQARSSIIQPKMIPPTDILRRIH